MNRRSWTTLFTLALACAPALGACAYNATGVGAPKVLIFEYSVEGDRILQSPDWAYYFVIDTKERTNPLQGPFINGPAPIQFPYPDARSYLPFIRDESTTVLDREPIAVPDGSWTTYFALYEDAGQLVMWQGRRNDDNANPALATINERFRQLQKGREWALKDNRTVQFTLPFNLIQEPGTTVDPAEWKANLAVARRGQGNYSRDFTIERWGPIQNQFFKIQTKPINQNLFDTVSGVTFPQNVPAGVDQRNMNFVTISYRVVAAEAN